VSHEVFIIVLTAILTTGWTASRVFKPLVEGYARRLGGTAGDVDGDTGVRIADLTTRINELEERLDFTERVLLQERQAGELGQGGSP
jgi:hypothetical protein